MTPVTEGRGEPSQHTPDARSLARTPPLRHEGLK